MPYVKTRYDPATMTVTVDDEQVIRALGVLSDKTPAVLKVAANTTARQTRKLMLAEVKKRYDLNAAGKRMIEDLRQRQKATNRNPVAILAITKNDPGAFRADLGYFKTKPSKPYMGRNVWRAPEYFQARVLKSGQMTNLSGSSSKSKGFLVKFQSGHVGMVQRQLGVPAQRDHTMSGKVRWKPNEKLVTMSSPSGSAMHHTVWEMQKTGVEEMLRSNTERRVAQIIANAQRKGKI